MTTQTLHVVCNLLPVGPRRRLLDGGSALFSLQIAGGLAEKPEGDPVDVARGLLPWILLPLSETITIHVGYRKADDTFAVVAANYVTPPDNPNIAGFREQLTKELTEQEELTEGERAGTLVWNRPMLAVEADDDDAVDAADFERNPQPALTDRLLYLSTLPTEVSRPLHSALYFTLDPALLDDLHPCRPMIVAAPTVTVDGVPRKPTKSKDPFAGPDPKRADLKWEFDGGGSDTAVVANVVPLDLSAKPNDGDQSLDIDETSFAVRCPHALSGGPVQRLEEKLDAASDPALLVVNTPRESLTQEGILPGSMADAIWNAFAATALYVDINPLPPELDHEPAPVHDWERRLWLDRQSWRRAAAALRRRMISQVLEAAGNAFSSDGPALPEEQELLSALIQTLNPAQNLFGHDEWLDTLREAAVASDLRKNQPQSSATEDAGERELVFAILQGAPDLGVLCQSFWLALLRAWRDSLTGEDEAPARGRFDALIRNLEHVGERAFQLEGVAFPSLQGQMRVRVLLRQLSGRQSGSDTLVGAREALKEHLRIHVGGMRDSPLLPRFNGDQDDHQLARTWLARRRLPHDQVAVDEFLDRLEPLLNDALSLAQRQIEGYVDKFPGLRDVAVERESVPSGLTFTFGKSHHETGDNVVEPGEQTRTFAGFAVAVQRRSPGAEDGLWQIDAPRLANAGLIADGAGTVLSAQPVVIPIRPAYGNDLLRPEITYEGAVLGVDDYRVRAIHSGVVERTAEPGTDPLDGQELLRFLPLPADRTDLDVLRPPPLRAGDQIRMAIWGIGSAGGLSETLSGADEMGSRDRLDPAHFAATAKSEAKWSDWAPVTRQVPIGDISLLPLAQDAAKAAITGKRRLEGEWPSLPSQVRPIIPELINRDDVKGLDVPGDDQQPPTAALLLMSQHSLKDQPGASKERRFCLLPPLAKPRSLTLWELPAVGAYSVGLEDQAEKSALIEQIIKVHAGADTARARAMSLQSQREAGLAFDSLHPDTFDPLFVDPAVAAVGVRLHRFYRRDSGWALELVGVASLSTSVAPGEAYDAQLIGVEIGNTDVEQPELTADPEKAVFSVNVTKDALLLLEFHALVSKSEKTRFGSGTWAAMQQGHRLQDQPHGRDPTWRDDDNLLMLPGDMVAIERVSDTLPNSERLRQALSLHLEGRAVHVCYSVPRPDSPAAPLTGALPEDYVAEFTVSREHWVWRGHPIAVRNPGAGDSFLNEGDGSPPWELMDPERRDTLPGETSPDPGTQIDPGEHLARWDAVLAMASGFVEHTLPSRQWDAQTWNDASGKTVILVDERTDRAGSDYHRYALRVRSRYSGVLGLDSAQVSTFANQSDLQRRRLFVPYRGPAPSAPMILATLPLTHGLAPAPFAAPSPESGLQSAAPVMVICDHAPFGVYGLGDRLVAELVREAVDGKIPPNSENGRTDENDDKSAAMPFRVGPAGDAYVAEERGGRYWGDGRTLSGRLKVWGPFGLTFETTAEEAKPATSAYIVYSPEEIGPHWIAEVAFRRAVYGYQKPGDNLEEPVEGTAKDPTSVTFSWAPQPDLISDSFGSHQIEFRGIGGDPEYLAEGRLRTVGKIKDDLRLDLQRGELPNLHPTLANPSPEDVAAVEDHRYVGLVSRLVTDAAIGDVVPLPIALYRIAPKVQSSSSESSLVLDCPRFSGDGATPQLGEGELILHLMEVRTDALRPSDATRGSWVFDDPTEHAPRNFWDALLPKAVRLKEGLPKSTSDPQGWRNAEPLDLPDAAGRIERVFGPYRLERAKPPDPR